MHFVIKATPINSTCHIKELKNSSTCLIGYSGFISHEWLFIAWGRTHTHTDTHIPTSWTKAISRNLVKPCDHSVYFISLFINITVDSFELWDVTMQANLKFNATKNDGGLLNIQVVQLRIIAHLEINLLMPEYIIMWLSCHVIIHVLQVQYQSMKI